MPLPYPISPSQTDCQSPVDDNLMDSIRLNLDYLDTLFSGSDYALSFGLDGELIGAAGFYRAVDQVPLFKEFEPNTCRIGLRKSGMTGQFKIDIRKAVECKIPIIGIDHQWSEATQSISQAGSSLNTQSISLATPAIATQSITFAKSTLAVQSIINVGGNSWRYNFSTTPDADYDIGDSILFASCTAGANNGTFTITEVNQSGGSNVVVTNASGVAQTSAAGSGQLQLMSYNFVNPVSSEFVAGESCIFSGHTAGANDGTKAIYAVNSGGNNLWVKNATGVAQIGVAGTTSVCRWLYAYSSAVSTTDYAVGEKAKMAGHFNALNDGNFTITAINSGSNNLIVYNPVGVAQGLVLGTANTNRWIYTQLTNPSSQWTVGDIGQLEGHTTAANNGFFVLKQINRTTNDNLVFYNEAGVAQAGVAGTTSHTNKLVKFSSNQSSVFTTDSFIEITGTPSGFYLLNDFRAPYQVLQVNRGGGSNFNVVINVQGGAAQASPAGYVQTEFKSIFTTLPEIDPDVTALQANEWVTFVSTDLDTTQLPAGTVLALFILEYQSGDPQSIKVTLHN